MVARAMGRYHSLLIKHGVEASAAYIKELKSILPSYLEGLVEGLDENSEEIGKSLEGLFESEELSKAIEKLGDKIEGILMKLSPKSKSSYTITWYSVYNSISDSWNIHRIFHIDLPEEQDSHHI